MEFDRNLSNENGTFDLIAKQLLLIELKALDEKLTKCSKQDSNLTFPIKKEL